MKLSLCGETVVLHHSGAAFMPDRGLLLVADLHLEKGSHFARRGFLVPPYDSLDTLTRLLSVCRELNARQIALLGDCFHDPDSFHRMTSSARDLFDALRAYDPLFIRGNHDGCFVPAGFAAHDSYMVGRIVLRHEAAHDTMLGVDHGEISGHFHPKAAVLHKGTRVERPCFVEDGRRLILPSFGAYTGGLSVKHAAVRALFQTAPRLYLLGENRIYGLSSG